MTIRPPAGDLKVAPTSEYPGLKAPYERRESP
jgi:hypothetical protein